MTILQARRFLSPRSLRSIQDVCERCLCRCLGSQAYVRVNSRCRQNKTFHCCGAVLDALGSVTLHTRYHLSTYNEKEDTNRSAIAYCHYAMVLPNHYPQQQPKRIISGYTHAALAVPPVSSMFLSALSSNYYRVRHMREETTHTYTASTVSAGGTHPGKRGRRPTMSY